MIVSRTYYIFHCTSSAEEMAHHVEKEKEKSITEGDFYDECNMS
jgi:hypothetical protein